MRAARIWQPALMWTLLLGLSGCAIDDMLRQVERNSRKTDQRLEQDYRQFAQAAANVSSRQAAQQVNRPWVVGKSTPLAREVTLPPALRSTVPTTLLLADTHATLPEIAQRLMTATRIPVHVRPEALLPAGRFAPRLAGDTAASVERLPISMSWLGEPQPLAQILDRVSAAFGVYWRYEHQRIEFYRTETRVFNVRSLTLGVSAQASLGASPRSGSEGFSSTSRTDLVSSPQKTMAVIQARIEPFLSRAGTAVAQDGGGALVVVTDTPEVLQRIAVYLDRENQSLTRRVRLVFEEVTLVMEDSAEAGIDWNVVFTGSRLAAAAVAPGLATAEAASLSLGLGSGPFAGTEAIIKALGKVGRVVRRSSVPVLTLNRRPVTHAVRTTFSYIDKVETTTAGALADAILPTVSVSQKEETVGSLLTLLPDAQDDGRILLSLAYDNTVAQPIKSVTFGDKANPLQLQQVTIDGNGTVQQLVLQPGQPVLVSGFDRRQEEAQTRRLNPEMPLVLGGSDSVSRRQLKTVILITAQIEEDV